LGEPHPTAATLTASSGEHEKTAEKRGADEVKKNAVHAALPVKRMTSC